MDLSNPKLIYFKGLLFVLTGLIACAIILLEYPSLKLALLLMLAIWCFARAYYFAFYVVERYADPGYKFAGLGSFAKHLLSRRAESRTNDPPMDQRTRPSRRLGFGWNRSPNFTTVCSSRMSQSPRVSR